MNECNLEKRGLFWGGGNGVAVGGGGKGYFQKVLCFVHETYPSERRLNASRRSAKQNSPYCYHGFTDGAFSSHLIE